MNQEEGKPAQKMVPGDVVIVNPNPNPKHWHGTTKDLWFAHVAVMIGEGKTTWLEPVSDEEYDKSG